MPPRSLQLNKRIETTVTVDASGNATAVLDVVPGPSWEVKQISISVTGGNTIPRAATYVGRDANGVFISNSLIGNADTDSDPNITLRAGDSVCCVWNVATPGARAKLTVVYDEVAY